MPAPRARDVRVGLLAHRPDVTGAPGAEEDDARADAIAARLRALGARVSRSSSCPVPEADTWPVFYADAASVHAATYPSRRDAYGPTVRAKLDAAARVDPATWCGRAPRCGAWRARAGREPDVDVVASPTLGLAELPPVGVDELEVRLPFSAYTRAFSYLGWPAVAVGDLHLAGRDASTVLALALALEQDGAVL